MLTIFNQLGSVQGFSGVIFSWSRPVLKWKEREGWEEAAAHVFYAVVGREHIVNSYKDYKASECWRAEIL